MNFSFWRCTFTHFDISLDFKIFLEHKKIKINQRIFNSSLLGDWIEVELLRDWTRSARVVINLSMYEWVMPRTITMTSCRVSSLKSIEEMPAIMWESSLCLSQNCKIFNTRSWCFFITFVIAVVWRENIINYLNGMHAKRV